MEISLFDKCLFEFIGTMVMILLGDGVCAACTLEKSKAKGAGWIVITMAWGFAVMCGVFIAGPYSGAHLNPAVSLGLAIAGKFAWTELLPYAAAQMLGGFCGALLVYVFYQDHFKATTDNPDGLLGLFCTMPAIEHKSVNLLSELIATCVLVFIILALGGTTGYAMNPARDLGPRIVHSILPLKGKRDSGWGYSWVPVAGPLAGAALAAGLFLLIYS